MKKTSKSVYSYDHATKEELDHWMNENARKIETIDYWDRAISNASFLIAFVVFLAVLVGMK